MVVYSILYPEEDFKFVILCCSKKNSNFALNLISYDYVKAHSTNTSTER